MTVLRNNFDTGPNGTTITAVNSGDVSGNNAFDGVGGVGTGVIREYSTNFSRPTAEFTARFATGSTAATPNVSWLTSMGSQTQIWFREYVLLSSYFGFNSTVFVADNGTVYCAFIGIKSTTGELFVLNGPQTTQTFFTTPTPLNAWFRLEARFQFSTTVGNWEVRLFSDADSDTPTETKSASSWNLGAASANSFGFGYGVSGFANYPSLYLSGLELNNEGWPGPAPFRSGKGVPGILTNPVAPFTDAS